MASLGAARGIEEHLLVHGQFFQCEAETHPRSASLADKVRVHMNTTVAPCFMYSLVFAFWLFLALRFVFGIQVPGCALSAAAVGLVIGIVAYLLVRSEVLT